MKSAALKPYYGVTGIQTREEMERLHKLVLELGMPQDRFLMAGILVSARGLIDKQLADPTQYVFPTEVGQVLTNECGILNVLHYNSRVQKLDRQIEFLAFESPNIHGVQLNIRWPKLDELRAVRRRVYIQIIMQLSAASLAEYSYDISKLIERLKAYQDDVEYVLIDPSGGLGLQFDPKFAIRFLEAADHAQLDFRFGIAGGLSADNLEKKLGPLLKVYPDLSFDAQSQLRDPTTGRLNVAGRCKPYFEAVRRLLQLQTSSS